MLEKKVEEAVCKHAKTLGYLVYKFTSPQRRSVPDRILISPSGKVLFVEFKAPGKRPTKMQERELNRLKEQGQVVKVVDNIEQGKHFVELWV